MTRAVGVLSSVLPRRDGLAGGAPGKGIALRLFFTCWLVYGLHFATNTVRELYPAMSLGDRLSFDVSEYLGLHPDIFAVPGRGAFINNNPGASMLGALPYALARPVIGPVVERVRAARARAPQGEAPEYRNVYPLAREFYRKVRERGLDIKFGLAAAVTNAFLMAPLSALSAVVMFRIVAAVTASTHAALLLALLYAFATPVFYRTAQLNQNLLVGHFALFAFALLWRPWDDPWSPRRPRYLLAGLLCGGAVVLDYSGILLAPVLGLYALARRSSLPREARSPADGWRFAAGVVLGVAPLLAYQWSAFGNPFVPAQYFMPPTRLTGYGYLGMDWPRLDLLWETAFGMRFGLFTSAPLLLLALYVPAWRRGPRLVGGRELGAILLLSAAFFLFCAANQYGRMQFNSGVRHIVPVVPFLFLLAAGVLFRMPRPAAALVGIAATYWSWGLAMYRDVERGLGIFEAVERVSLEGFRLPWLTTLEQMGYVAAGASPLPLFVLAGAALWVLWGVRVSPIHRIHKEG